MKEKMHYRSSAIIACLLLSFSLVSSCLKWYLRVDVEPRICHTIHSRACGEDP